MEVGPLRPRTLPAADTSPPPRAPAACCGGHCCSKPAGEAAGTNAYATPRERMSTPGRLVSPANCASEAVRAASACLAGAAASSGVTAAAAAALEEAARNRNGAVRSGAADEQPGGGRETEMGRGGVRH
jgi:hypothetical protein